MSDIALDDDGDWLFVNGDLQIVTGDAAIIQQLAIRLKFVLGEWFLDTRVGIPMFEEVFGKNPDLIRVRSIYTQTILTTPGIASLQSFSLTLDNAVRLLSVVFVAVKDDGTLLDFSDEFIIK